MLTNSPTAFQIAIQIAAPVRDKLDVDELSALIDDIERAIAQAQRPPVLLLRDQAARYVRERFGIPLTAKDGPPFRRFGKRLVYARDDLDRWATDKAMAVPVVRGELS
jgi:hypothetical protein